jgi:hypothetical protein
LLDMTVRHARMAFFHQHLLRQSPGSAHFVHGYLQERASWPRLWNIVDPGPSAAGPSTEAPPHPDSLGLSGLEERWIASALAPADAPTTQHAPTPEDLPQHAWLDLQRDRPIRPSPADRAAHRLVEPAPLPIPLRAGFSQVWKRLADKTLHRPYRITCWRLLHGTLGCKAFLSHVRRHFGHDPSDLAIASPYCDALGCLQNLFLRVPQLGPCH